MNLDSSSLKNGDWRLEIRRCMQTYSVHCLFMSYKHSKLQIQEGKHEKSKCGLSELICKLPVKEQQYVVTTDRGI